MHWLNRWGLNLLGVVGCVGPSCCCWGKYFYTQAHTVSWFTLCFYPTDPNMKKKTHLCQPQCNNEFNQLLLATPLTPFADHHNVVTLVFFHRAAIDRRKGNSQWFLNNSSVPPSLSNRQVKFQTDWTLKEQQEVRSAATSECISNPSLFTWIGCKRPDLFSGLSGHVQTVLDWLSHAMFVLFLSNRTP